MKKLSRSNLHILFTAIYGAFAALILVFALFGIDSVAYEKPTVRIYIFLTFLMLCLNKGFHVAVVCTERKGRMPIIRNSVLSGLFLLVGILTMTLPDGMELYGLLATFYFGAIIMNRTFVMIERRKIRSYITNGLLILLSFGVISFSWSPEPGTRMVVMSAVLMVVIVVSTVDVLSFAFSRIQLRGLLRIIRETFVIEIIYGLIILMIAASFYFAIMEEEIPTFWDGMWYSFATITTIGFGDYTVHSFVGRIVTVVLGLYGIVVVAAITSVIVNYYAETRDARKEKLLALNKKEGEKTEEELEEEEVEEQGDEP